MPASSKFKIILFSREITNCACYNKIFNGEFDTSVTDKENDFSDKIQNQRANAGIVCFCSAKEKDVDELLRLDALSGPMPILACSKTLNPDFIQLASKQGVNHFLFCQMAPEKIRTIINDLIRDGGVKEYLQSRWSSSQAASLHLHKLINEIVHTFPQRLKVQDFAIRLGIRRSWLHKLCHETFDMSLSSLLRHIRVHQALRIMQYTNLDNTEIAMQLNYSEESSMARDFRKELQYSPNEARKRLSKHNPAELLLK